MPSRFLPRRVNPPCDDPGLFLPFRFARRALLFDLGDNAPLSPRDLLKTSHVFVTHTHMDHFVGFDRLLRCCLGREKELFLFGPPGFIGNVEGKLAGYTWDLVERFSANLRLHLTEVRPEGRIQCACECRRRFQPGPKTVAPPSDGPLHAEPEFHVTAALLRHSTPCLGFALTERFGVNILKTELTALGLTPGPWLSRFKAALYAGADPCEAVETGSDPTGSSRRFTLGELSGRIARITAGRKIAYVTDVADTPGNRNAIIALARDADLLFIESPFLDRDRELAAAKHHLTARQAGEIAAQAGVKRFSLFHFSPRYQGREAEILAEAQQAYEQTGGGGAETNRKSQSAESESE
ncbi:MAG: MBL fold metallo-hydrolase [Desulfobacterales bacterium]|jgi:ribonuclease Z|nr:MBL fold metallo-hydrolase [Desulfobacterales bacterium]